MQEYDDISNKAIAAHLSRQDAAIAEVKGLLEDSIADRRVLHASVDEIISERKRLVHENEIYQQAMGERMTAVEARGDLADIRASLGELAAASAVQLRVHRWWTKNRVRSRVAVAVGWAVTVLAPTVLTIVARHLGWV